MSDAMSPGAEEKCFKTIAQSAPPVFQNGKVVLQAYHIGWIISGLFTLVALVVSFWLIRKHLQWYTNKREQRYIVRLLFMVPLYAVISFASFLFWNHSTPLILIRDAYEAIVLTAFFYLLLMYLSHDSEEQKRLFIRFGLSVEADSIAIQKGDDIVKWVFPLGFIKWKPRDGLYFLQLMKWGVLQYCVIRPTSTLAAVILNYVGLYCEDSWGVGWGHIYITIVMSLSVTIAMYCLLQLYFPVSTNLTPHQPLLKLFSVKAVVFLTFWQATFLSLLSLFGVIKDTKYMTADDVNNAIAAILETFEMMLFAFLHIRAFTYKPYARVSKEGFFPTQTPQWRSLGHAMDFRETFREIWVGCIYMFDSMRGKEPTPDFGVIRGSHYESAFGRPRQTATRPPQPPRDRIVKVADLIYPTVEVEVDQEVEVVVNGKREWLLLGYSGQRPGHPPREKSEGLQEQIDRELALRGYSSQAIDRTHQSESILNPYTRRAGQRSWWRKIYNRISQSGQEPEEERETSGNPRSQRHRKSGRSHPDINGQSPEVFNFSPPPAAGVVYERYDARDEDGDYRRPNNDSDRANQSWYEDRSIPVLGLPLHSNRHSRKSDRAVSTLPSAQCLEPLAPSSHALGEEAIHMAYMPLSQSAPHRGLAVEQTVAPTDTPEMQQTPNVYLDSTWDSAPIPRRSSPRDTSVTAYRKSIHRSEAATMPQGNKRVHAWLQSTQPRDSAIYPDGTSTYAGGASLAR